MNASIVPEFKSLTSFRFVCALVVFLFHCSIHLNWRLNFDFFDPFFNNSATFMTGFFVLSGYIMAVVYQATNFSERTNIFRYWIKRFAKIYPVYIISTILYFSIFNDFSLIQWMLIVVNDLFLTQSFIRELFSLGINGGSWSISNEAVFYFIFPFIILVVGKHNRMLFACGWILVAIMNINILGVAQSLGVNSIHFYANPIVRVGEFMVGMAFGIRPPHPVLMRIKPLVTFLGIVLLTSLNWSSSKYMYMGLNFLLVPAFALLMAQLQFSTNSFMCNSIFVYLGKISYSFYLFQFFPMEIAKASIKLHPGLNIHLTICAAFFANIALSVISYHLIEEPLRQRIIAKMSGSISS